MAQTGAQGLTGAPTSSTRNVHTPAFTDEVPDRRGTASLKWSKYGDDILPLWVADMDFKAAQPIIDALKARAEHGVFGYTQPVDRVTHEVAAYLHRAHGFEVDPSWIVWSHGLVPALTVISRMVGAQGGEVMTNTPIYPPFLWTPETAGMRTIQVPLVYDESLQHWAMDYDAMERLVTPHTRMFSLCNPHNPVGRVFTAHELRRLGDFCVKHDLLLMSDEIYHDLILDAAKTPHVPISALGMPELLRRTIILHAASKTYNIPGLSCAYAVIPDEKLRERYKHVARGFVTEINCFGYEGTYAAYTRGEPWRQGMLKYLVANRDFMTDFIKRRIPEIRCFPNHDATYLMWLDARGLLPLLPEGVEPAAFFMDKAKVAVSEGRDFGTPGYIRINFGCPRPRLEQGLEMMAQAVASLRAN